MSRRGQIFFFVPAILVFCVFVLIPSTRTLIDSFYAHQASGQRFVGGLYYQFALSDAKFHQSLRNNLVYMAWTLVFEVVVGLALAVALQKQNRLNKILRIVFFSPSVLSMVVIGLVFGFLFKDGIGLLPGMLNESRALFTISVISGWAYCGVYMIVFLAGLTVIPGEILEAAELDGATPWRVFWSVKLPLLRHTFFVALVICFTGAFKAFDLFWVMLPNQDHTSIVSTMLVREVMHYDNRGYGSALAVLLTIVVMLIAATVYGLNRLWSRERAVG